MPRVLDIHSGYDARRSDWRAFLHAWFGYPKKYPGTTIFNVLDMRRGTSDDEIAALQQRLNLPHRPPSYVDFLHCVRIDAARCEAEDYGLEPLENIDYFPSIDPELFKFFQNEAPEDSPDEKYFVYGKEQDNAQFKDSLWGGMVVLGTLFPNDYLLLNTQVQTKDGEFECILYSYTSSFRTLSFAAMMRAWCVYEMMSSEIGSYPPYEDSLMNSAIPALIASGR